ncbi:MAG: outer membrane beta-barrel protein [Syntrophotaleaceae bacterium]
MVAANTVKFCLMVSLLFLWGNLLASNLAIAADGFSTVHLQGYVGAASFDEDAMTFYQASETDPDTGSTTDLSSMPYLGLSVQYALSPKPTHVGIDTSLLFGWRSDDSSAFIGNGQARVKIDAELWFLDLAVGVYAQTVLGERWRVYGAVGPMLLFGEYSDDTEEEDLSASPTTEQKESSSDSAFGYGGYAKLGVEYALSRNNYIGIAVRAITTTLEFDNALDDSGLSGFQGFATFTHVYSY